MVLRGFPVYWVTICLLILLLFTVACGGGGSADPETAPPDQPPDHGEVPVDPPSACDCDPLEIVVGEVTQVSDTEQLVAAVAASNEAGGNRTILIEDGQYDLNDMLYITAGNVLIRSRSGHRESVVLRGRGMYSGVSHVFLVAAPNVTIADLSLGEVYYHGVQVQGENGGHDLTIHNVRVFNTGEQMIKGSYSDGTGGSRNGIVECSLFEYTDAFGPQWYIGGIDVHSASNWIVRSNTFKNIRSPGDALAEFAVHFWSDSRNPLIESNIIINCDRGIGLGLGMRGCIGGLIRNNTIYANHQGLYNDVGIGLETTSDVKVFNNTIFLDHDYSNAIEYRFTASSGDRIVNNLTNKTISSRDGATAALSSNITNAAADWFVDAASGNLHLASPIATVVDAGETLSEVPDDMDGETRPEGMRFDIGADEYGN